MRKIVGKGTKSFYAYVAGNDGKEYSITESIYFKTDHAIKVIQKGNKISFVPEENVCYTGGVGWLVGNLTAVRLYIILGSYR